MNGDTGITGRPKPTGTCVGPNARTTFYGCG